MPGETVTLRGIPHTIVGVLPREFHFAPYGAAEFWTTLRSTDPCEQNRGCQNLYTVARLKAGGSIRTASARMQPIAQQLQKQYPDVNRDFGSASVTPLRDVVVEDVRPILLMLLSGAGVLLLIACVNVTTLLLVRSDSRRREFAVRGALGGSSARLFQQFATEGLVLAAAGGLFGLILAEWGMRILASLVPANKIDSMPYLRELGLNPLTIVLACLLSLFAALLFAIIPTVRMSLSEMLAGLKGGTRGSASTTWRRFGANLMVVEVALATVLMVSAGLIGKSLYTLLHVDTGMRPDHLAALGLNWPPARYSSDEQKVALERQIVEQVSVLPGVKSVGISLTSPLGTAWGSIYFHVAGQPNHGEHNEVLRRQVSSGYFTTLQARLIRGRHFHETEDAAKPRVAIINRTLATKYFAGEDPVGKRIYYDWKPQSLIEIVGIVEDIKEGSLEAANPPVLYVPFNQNPVSGFAVLVRTSTTEQSAIPAIAATIRQIDRDITVGAGTMTERIHDSPAAYRHRSSTWLVGTFAAIAFFLTVVGLYGVIAYSVSQRTREIGVRVALGASPGSVHALILKEGARLAVTGTVLGILCSVGATALIRRLLFGVDTSDIAALSAAVAFVLICSALLASYDPARRATSVHPIEALRSE